VEEHEFKQLYDTTAKRLYNFILWTTGNRSVCDDILQNVFFKVWRCEKTPSDAKECLSWLYAITRNACIDYFRSTRKFMEYSDAIATAETATVSDREDDGKLAWHEAAQLPETERSIVYLHCKMGYSYGEIGRMVDLTENNVRVKAFRALKKLREILIKKGL
jgi:RNA polymerase sigma factor (sigma-70 family)